MKRVMMIVCFMLSLTPDCLFSQEEEQIDTVNQWSDFQLIIENNIFNPNRRKFVEQPPPPVREPVPQIDELMLVGTLVTENQKYAFFDGNASVFRKVLSSNDQIGNCTISEIHTTSVVLQTDINSIRLSVGKSLKRIDDGVWEYSEMSPSLLSQSNNKSDEAQDRDVPESSGAANDLLKQLMERRQQELNQ